MEKTLRKERSTPLENGNCDEQTDHAQAERPQVEKPDSTEMKEIDFSKFFIQNHSLGVIGNLPI